MLKMDGGDFRYETEAITAYDADSVRMTLIKRWDFGFHLHIQQRYKIAARIKGIDAPELRDKRPHWKAAAYLARNQARVWLAWEPLVFVSMDKPDKYGRALGDLERPDGLRLTTYLVNERLAVPYEGQAKSDVEAAHAENIAWLLDQGLI